MASTIWIYSFNSFEAVRVMENCNAPTEIVTTVLKKMFYCCCIELDVGEDLMQQQ
jgi:hypothetical protein